MTNLRDDLAEVMKRVNRSDCEEYALRYVQFFEDHAADIERNVRDAERRGDALEKIAQWSKAYPIECFPEPDWKRAAEVLRAAGMSLDSISASNMRHVITKVQKIADDAMQGGGE